MKHCILLWRFSLSLLLLSGFVMPTKASSECDFEVNNICYNFLDKAANEVEITYRWYEGGRYGDGYSSHYSDIVVIPETVTYGSTTYKVTAIGRNAFRECYNLKSVNIPNTITSIGDYAFSDCI